MYRCMRNVKCMTVVVAKMYRLWEKSIKMYPQSWDIVGWLRLAQNVFDG